MKNDMLATIGLEGEWGLRLDPDKRETEMPYDDAMELPGTTSHARKGTKNTAALAGSLTDEYAFEGYAWFSREVDIPETLAGLTAMLYLERTRITTVWVDGRQIGSRNSLCTPHVYDLGRLTAGRRRITIRVDNTGYPTKGGHMTSADTQTNWNGITGRIELQFYGDTHLSDVQLYPDAMSRTLTIRAKVIGKPQGTLAISAASEGPEADRHQAEPMAVAVSEAEIAVRYELGEDARLWSDADPNLYKVTLTLTGEDGRLLDEHRVVTGLRDFRAVGDKFAVNGAKTFLRGKHDGLLFPLTGYAPTTLDEWLRVLRIAKSYGINHYRFHTCCPPAAAFEAADRLGIYMEPELPFWGTVTDENDANHKEEEQNYLIEEGFSMLRTFGNHPSFVMMSLGNELWGSKRRLSEILQAYKAHDNRRLYTQGSNNFQFVPVILEEDDFYCGVRFSKDRLFRGSYAMCDAPLGHVQTDPPGTMKDYDEQIVPTRARSAEAGTEGGELQIQYGTEAVTVKAEAADELVPAIPVVSHEIGQYAMYPNYREIDKYTGPLKARNFEIFRERLEAKGMGHLAGNFFESSGKLAVACYKEELEAAFRSRRLAGFQLLDLQDFSGQGTALVGILDAFMDAKGLIEPEEWRSFCSDAVLLARFETYNWVSEERFRARVELAWFKPEPLRRVTVHWELTDGTDVLAGGRLNAEAGDADHYIDVGELEAVLPYADKMTKASLQLRIPDTDVRKTYDLWIYPSDTVVDPEGVHLFEELSEEAVSLLELGANVVLLPKPDRLSNAIEGTYCTDFWNYPMFRSISESMNKPVPVGTLGLLIDHEHPVFADFPCEPHSTYPWWNIVSRSRSLILDDMPPTLGPIVQTIDNVERNHKLGLMFECRVLNGSLLVCSLDAGSAADTPEGKQLLSSIIRYAKSGSMKPQTRIELADLRKLLI